MQLNLSINKQALLFINLIVWAICEPFTPPETYLMYVTRTPPSLNTRPLSKRSGFQPYTAIRDVSSRYLAQNGMSKTRSACQNAVDVWSSPCPRFPPYQATASTWKKWTAHLPQTVPTYLRMLSDFHYTVPLRAMC
jgi:hypothetical protein